MAKLNLYTNLNVTNEKNILKEYNNNSIWIGMKINNE